LLLLSIVKSILISLVTVGAVNKMDIWYSKSLGDATLASQPLDHLKELFLLEYAKAGIPKDMAVFIRHESEGRLQCELIAYFSPAAVAVSVAADADPCARPSMDSLSMLAGDEASWPLLFPDQRVAR
jgi:hypothetical protein